MKTKAPLLFFLLFASSLWAQEPTVEINLDDIIVIEDASAPEVAPEDVPEVAEVEPVVEPEMGQEATVVEIGDEFVGEAELDFDAPVIPVATDLLPDETEVVLELPGQEPQLPGSVDMATEETISVDFPDEDVRTILRNVADLFDLNLVIPETFQGRTSIKLSNVTWRQVFDVVTEPLGMGYYEDKGIIYIKPIEEVVRELLSTQTFTLSQVLPSFAAQIIEPHVDEAIGGAIVFDDESNILVVTERPENMEEVSRILSEYKDQGFEPAPLVMVEAKFVEVTKNDAEDIGVNWSSLKDFELAAANINREWSQEFSREIGSSAEDAEGSGFSLNNGLIFDNFETTGDTLTRTASTGRVDSAVFSASDFRVVLSALQENRDVELISNPTVVVLSGQKAEFQVGEDYPIRLFSFNPESGIREPGDVDYKELGIKLEVTPRVRGSVIDLDIVPEVSALAGTVGELEDPIIAKKIVDTSVRIQNGYTIALGGLIEEETTNETTKVPILGSLPGIGNLFRDRSDRVQKTSLIVFITAREISDDGSGSYRDIIDPRVLHEMGITPADVPGYSFNEKPDEDSGDMDESMPEEYKALLKQLEIYRTEAKISEMLEAKRALVKEIEEAKLEQLEEAANPRD